MRTIKTLATPMLALCLVTAFGLNAYGQMDATGVMNMHGGLMQMIKKLDLKPQQEQQIEQILGGEAKQLKHAGGNPDQEKAIRAQGREQIASVLTPVQKAKLKKMLMQKAASEKGNPALQEEASSW